MKVLEVFLSINLYETQIMIIESPHQY